MDEELRKILENLSLYFTSHINKLYDRIELQDVVLKKIYSLLSSHEEMIIKTGDNAFEIAEKVDHLTKKLGFEIYDYEKITNEILEHHRSLWKSRADNANTPQSK